MCYLPRIIVSNKPTELCSSVHVSSCYSLADRYLYALSDEPADSRVLICCTSYSTGHLYPLNSPLFDEPDEPTNSVAAGHVSVDQTDIFDLRTIIWLLKNINSLSEQADTGSLRLVDNEITNLVSLAIKRPGEFINWFKSSFTLSDCFFIAVCLSI
ncbi:hypothetical protein BRC62_03925 [Halobacteriales archaeon QH_10_67_13]|nr:MAG: hypothetical protein BRC62_03925 [Halobacteriales archaeon QH_10_67_13]